MNSVFSFGSYYPGSSPLHKLDPRTKLLAGMALIAAALLSQDFWGLGVVALFVAAFYALSRIPLGKACRSLCASAGHRDRSIRPEPLPYPRRSGPVPMVVHPHQRRWRVFVLVHRMPSCSHDARHEPDHHDHYDDRPNRRV